MMRPINRIILHCTATSESRDFSAADIDRWHRERGWRGIGYHYVIRLDGSIEQGRPIEQIGAHVKGHNADSVGIVYVGGLTADGSQAKDTRTPAQKDAMFSLVARLCHEYSIPVNRVYGHREFSAKYCPSFDPEQFRRSLSLSLVQDVPQKDIEPSELPMLDLRGCEAKHDVLTLQRRLGVADDGIIGPDTWGAILEQLGSHECRY